MIKQPDSSAAKPVTLTDRRLFLQLPLEERRRRLAEQANQAAGWYEQQSAEHERSIWQGGDIVEY